MPKFIRPSSYKYCFVPGCKSTTIRTPNKRFLFVPSDGKIRKKWCKMCRTSVGSKSTFYCCEDHFDLENDFSNMVAHQLTGRALRLKSGVLPTKFDCHPDRKKSHSRKERQSGSKRRRKEFIDSILSMDAEKNHHAKALNNVDPNQPSTSSQGEILPDGGVLQNLHGAPVPDLTFPNKNLLCDNNVIIKQEIIESEVDSVDDCVPASSIPPENNFTEPMSASKNIVPTAENTIPLTLVGVLQPMGFILKSVGPNQPCTSSQEKVLPDGGVFQYLPSIPVPQVTFQNENLLCDNNIRIKQEIMESEDNSFDTCLPESSIPPKNAFNELINTSENIVPIAENTIPLISVGVQTTESIPIVPTKSSLRCENTHLQNVFEIKNVSRSQKFSESSSNEGNQRPRDKFDAYAEFMASKLRELDSRSCAFVQTAIADLFFEAELGRFLSEGDKSIFSAKIHEVLKKLPSAYENKA